MSGRLLSFKQYIGGADDVQVIEKFPSEQKTFTYNYGTDISNYSFELDAQTIVVDTVTYNVNTGDPVFSTSNVVGYFANVDVLGLFFLHLAHRVHFVLQTLEAVIHSFHHSTLKTQVR